MTKKITCISVGTAAGLIVNQALKQNLHNVEFVSLDDKDLEKLQVPNTISSRVEVIPSSSNVKVLPLQCYVSLDCEADIDNLLAKTDFLVLLACLGSSNTLITSHFVATRSQQRAIASTAILTTPMHWEGSKTNQRAQTNLQLIKENMDSVIVYDLNTMLENAPQDTPTKLILNEANKKILQMLETVISNHS